MSAGCARLVLAFAVFMSTGLHASQVFADRALAAAAFDRGNLAFRTGSYVRAAEAYEEAFQQFPAPEALLQAARSHLRAGERARAATLCQTLLEVFAEHESVPRAERVLAELASVLVQLEVACEDCAVEVDGRSTRPVFFVEPDTAHTVVATMPRGHQVEFVVIGRPGDFRTLDMPADISTDSWAGADHGARPAPDLRPAAAAQAPPPASVARAERRSDPVEDSSGLSPMVTYVGVGLTTALIAAGAAATINAAQGVSDYEAAAKTARDCAQLCQQLDARAAAMLEDGRDRESLAVLTWAAAGAAGLVTATIGLLFTDWDGEREQLREPGPAVDFAVSPHPDGTDASLRVRF